jgi:hypothetical protein
MNTQYKALGVAAAAAIAIGSVVATPAAADTFIPLPDGAVTTKIGGGAITIKATRQSAKLSPGMVALPTTRNAWVSGSVRATIKGAEPGNGSIQAGYVVGCQVQVGDANIGISGSASGASLTTEAGKNVYAGGAAGSGASLNLSAGTIGTQYLTLDKPTWPKGGDAFSPSVSSDMGWTKPSQSFAFEGDSGSLNWSDTTIGVDGCAGYAQARFYAYVTGKVGNHEGTGVLWGKPFTLG